MWLLLMFIVSVLCGIFNYKFLNWFMCDQFEMDLSNVLFVFFGSWLTTTLFVVFILIASKFSKEGFKTYFAEQIAYHNEKKNHNNYYYDWRERHAVHQKYIEDNEELEVPEDFKEMF